MIQNCCTSRYCCRLEPLCSESHLSDLSCCSLDSNLLLWAVLFFNSSHCFPSKVTFIIGQSGPKQQGYRSCRKIPRMGKCDEAEKVHDSPCKVTFITDGSQTNLESLNPHAERGLCVDFRENVSNWSRGTANSVLHGKCPLLLIGTKLTANSFYFFTNLIHLVFFTILAYLSLRVSDQSVHHQEDEMLNYTSSFWRRSLGRWSVVGGRWC